LYERLVERCFRGAKLQQISAVERAEVLEVMTALRLLLQQEPRLLGLLASKTALSPLVAALAPAASTYPPLMTTVLFTSSGGSGIPAAAGDGDSSGGSSKGEVSVSHVNGDAAGLTNTGLAGVGATSGSRSSSSSGSNSRPTGPSLAVDAERLAYSALQLLLLVTQSHQVMDALLDEQLLRQLHWLLHQPPSCRVLQLTLELLKAVAVTATAAVVAGYQGGAVLLLSLVLHPTGSSWPWPGGEAVNREVEEGVVKAAAGVLGKMMSQPGHGPRVKLLMSQLLPPGLVMAVEEGPPEALLRALASVRGGRGRRVGKGVVLCAAGNYYRYQPLILWTC
jgi:DnaJ family protein C protein 13